MQPMKPRLYLIVLHGNILHASKALSPTQPRLPAAMQLHRPCVPSNGTHTFTQQALTPPQSCCLCLHPCCSQNCSWCSCGVAAAPAQAYGVTPASLAQARSKGPAQRSLLKSISQAERKWVAAVQHGGETLSGQRWRVVSECLALGLPVQAPQHAMSKCVCRSSTTA